MRLVAGKVNATVEEPKPIFFRAEVNPVTPGSTKPGERGPAAGQTRYSIRYLVPGVALQLRKNGQQSEAVIGIAFLATDRNGKVLLQHAKQVTYSVDAAAAEQEPNKLVAVTQELDLNRGDTYLSLLLWDGISERVGTLSLSLKVS